MKTFKIVMQILLAIVKVKVPCMRFNTQTDWSCQGDDGNIIIVAVGAIRVVIRVVQDVGDVMPGCFVS